MHVAGTQSPTARTRTGAQSPPLTARACCAMCIAQERGRILYRLADLMERDAEELAQLETLVRRRRHG